MAAGKSSPVEWRWNARERVNPREYNIAAMVILALETVTRAGSLALRADRGPETSMTGDPQRTHGVRLPEDIMRFVRAAGLTLREVDCFAVVTGPGSFTGLRVGLATIQGLALANERPVIGIPTLEALASGWLDHHTGQDGLLVPCLDGARGDVFYAAYAVTGAERIEDARLAIEPRVAGPGVAAADVAAAGRGAGLTLIGDMARDATVFLAALPEAQWGTPMPNLAAAAARLAARRLSSATPPHALRPIYIRRPDAELARDRAGLDRPSAPNTGRGVSGWGEAFSMFEATSPGDVSEVAALQERAFGRSWGSDSLAAGQGTADVAWLYAVRHQSGELVAYCAGWRIVDEIHINSMAVEARYRRQGVARTMLRQILALGSASGATSATLEVRESNRAGRALYEGLGFRVEGLRRGYYEQPIEDALIMWRRNLVGPAA